MTSQVTGVMQGVNPYTLMFVNDVVKNDLVTSIQVFRILGIHHLIPFGEYI
tara:strand:+ start:161 stop:313 length:153 start_codon:yes stop_codon:yes gene_type:complete